jgi:hypothetical protein
MQHFHIMMDSKFWCVHRFLVCAVPHEDLLLQADLLDRSTCEERHPLPVQ